MKWKKQLLSLTPYQPGKSIEEVKKQFGLTSITKLASNENPFGCSPNVLKAIKDNSRSCALYPDGYATEIREAVAKKLNVTEKQLIFGNGSDEVIQIISRSLLSSSTNTIMATPTFPQYRHNAVIEGAEIREVPLINGEHSLEQMYDQIDENTSVVWLCSPNNPTGTYIPNEKLVSFLEKVSSDVLVVLDEAYYEYVDAEDYYNSLELLKKYSNLIVLRTFSKIYGLASFRIGYGIASEEIIQKLEPAREPFNTNVYAQLAATVALADEQFILDCKQKNREGIEKFYQFCDKNGLRFYPSQGNFILVDFNMDGQEVFEYLLEHGYIVRSGKALGFPTSVRITIGSDTEVAGVIDVLEQMLEEKRQKVN